MFKEKFNTLPEKYYCSINYVIFYTIKGMFQKFILLTILFFSCVAHAQSPVPIIETEADLDGFYYQDKRIFPEIFSNHRIDMLGIMFSFGLAGGGTKSILTGSSSINQVERNKQEIILIINRNVDVAGNILSTITND